MATIKLDLRKAERKQDGTFSVKFRITNGTSVSYITTKYSVKENQWNGGQVIRHPQALAINSKLFQMLDVYQTRLDELDPGKGVTASQIKEWLERGEQSDLLADYARKYIDQLEANGQKSYAQNMGYTLKSLTDCFGESVRLKDISAPALKIYEDYLYNQGGAKKKKAGGPEAGNKKLASPTTVNIRMSHLKALLNAALTEGIVEYKVFPFRGYKMPTKNVRDIWINKAELARLREAEFTGISAKRLTVARDLFMLSFYCAGINLTDLMDAQLEGDVLTFVRKKTASKKKGSDIQVSITVQPEAREIIDKYVNEQGKLVTGYQYSDYGQFRSFVTKSLNRIGEELGFEKKLMFYSARKTFVQFGSELGIPLHILEYAIGQTIKEANNRPIFNYLKVMRQQADLAIRTIIDYSTEPETEEGGMPLPEWARRPQARN